MRRPLAVRRRSPLPFILVGLALLVFGVVGTVATLVALGKIQLLPSRPQFSTEGMVAFPISVRTIPANTLVSRDDVWDARTQQISVFYVPRKDLDPDIETDLGKIIGRVLKFQQLPGYGFAKGRFYEEGTRPGLVAAVPPGKRALALNASKLQGSVFGLAAGDHLDILATAKIDDLKNHPPSPPGGIPTDQSAFQAASADRQQKAVIRVLVHDGTVITPVRPPQVTPRGRPLPQTRPEQEIVLAVDPAEVGPLTEALATSMQITLLARSGRPRDAEEVAVPLSAQPIPAYTQVTRDYLLDPLTGATKLVYFRTDKVDPSLVTDPYKIVGQVLAHDKPAGSLFTTDDFLPEGTRPGLLATIPAGKRALALDRAKIQGIEFGLKPGDHLDLVVTIPTDPEKALSRLHVAGYHPDPAGLPALWDPQNKMAVKVLVQNSTVIAPRVTGQVPSGPTPSRTPPQNIILAVDPGEVAPLTQALAGKLEIMAVTRSAAPDDPGARLQTPGANSGVTLSGLEVIRGGKREFMVFPRGTDGAVQRATAAMTPPAPGSREAEKKP